MNGNPVVEQLERDPQQPVQEQALRLARVRRDRTLYLIIRTSTCRSLPKLKHRFQWKFTTRPQLYCPVRWQHLTKLKVIYIYQHSSVELFLILLTYKTCHGHKSRVWRDRKVDRFQSCTLGRMSIRTPQSSVQSCSVVLAQSCCVSLGLGGWG